MGVGDSYTTWVTGFYKTVLTSEGTRVRQTNSVPCGETHKSLETICNEGHNNAARETEVHSLIIHIQVLCLKVCVGESICI